MKSYTFPILSFDCLSQFVLLLLFFIFVVVFCLFLFCFLREVSPYIIKTMLKVQVVQENVYNFVIK